MNTAHLPRLAVVEVTAYRPGQPVYHAKVQTLLQRIVSEGARAGWHVTRHAAGDVSTSELLSGTDDVDAVVIAGGEDIHPSFYGELTGYEGESDHYVHADEGQIALVRRAVDRATPLLGICRGMQIINVALGGTLTQHIDDEGLHKNWGVPIDQIISSHHVEIDADSGLALSLGDTPIVVRSAHHQGVAGLGAGLRRAGSAPDGLLEALEHMAAPVTGVQWHPEASGAPAEQLPQLLAHLTRQLSRLSQAA
jgi:putative glutamine amidotransferase